MMKNLCWIISLLLLLGCKSDSENDASKRNADWIWWIDEHTGKGEWIKSGDHTTVKDGKYTTFYFNGHVYSKGRLKNGVDFDTIFYFDTAGKCYGFNIDINGINAYYFYKNGPLKIYFNTGELKAEGVIANNRREKWVSYLKNGQIKFSLDYTNGVGWGTDYYDNGKPKEVYYRLGYDDSGLNVRQWNEAGTLIFEAEISNGKYNGIMKRYYDNGNIKSLSTFENDLENGLFQGFFENGSLNFKGYSYNDLKNGEYYQYYDNGQLEFNTHYKNDKPEGLLEAYFKNGKRKAVCYLKNGKKDGLFYRYDSTGKLISKEIYQNDLRLN